MDKSQVIKGTIIQQLVQLATKEVSRSSGIGDQVVTRISYLLHQHVPEGSLQDSLLSEAIMELQPSVRSAVSSLIKTARSFTPRAGSPEVVASMPTEKAFKSASEPSQDGSAKTTLSPYQQEIEDFGDILTALSKVSHTARLITRGLISTVRQDIQGSFFLGLKGLLASFLEPRAEYPLDKARELLDETQKKLDEFIDSFANLGIMTSKMLLTDLSKEWLGREDSSRLCLLLTHFYLEADTAVSEFQFNLGSTDDEVDYESLYVTGITDQDVKLLKIQIENAQSEEEEFVVRRGYERAFQTKHMFAWVKACASEFLVSAVDKSKTSANVAYRDDDDLLEAFEILVRASTLRSVRELLKYDSGVFMGSRS